jgi:hypothetical protein
MSKNINKDLLPLLLFFCLTQILFAKTDIEFILDGSGSMHAKMAGATQMDVAKQAIKTALDSLPPGAFVALRVYAHRVEQSNKEASCFDSELMIPFGTLNKSEFISKLDSIQPKGWTPIAYSLGQAANDFGTERESEHVLVLVSDGEETCGGDPVRMVNALSALGFKVKVHTVGFNVDAKAQEQLKAIAEAGKGKYYDARDPASLGNSLKEITEETFIIEKTSATYGSEIRGGDSYETAVPLKPNQEYHLDHHQRSNQFDYFYVDLNDGQQLDATISTLEKGVEIRGDSAVVTASYPYAGLQIHDSLRKKMDDAQIIGKANETKLASAYVQEKGRFYIVIGSTYQDMHKDCPFKIEITDYYDAGTKQDAGESFETALPIEKGKSYPKNAIGDTDLDVYRIVTSKGENLSFVIMPTNPKSRLEAIVYDEMHVKLEATTAANEGAGLQFNAVASGPTTYIQIQDRNRDFMGGGFVQGTEYSLSVKGAEDKKVISEDKPTEKPTEKPSESTGKRGIVMIVLPFLIGLAIGFGTGIIAGFIFFRK